MVKIWLNLKEKEVFAFDDNKRLIAKGKTYALETLNKELDQRYPGGWNGFVSSTDIGGE